MHRKDVLVEVNSNGYDGHEFPSPSWHSVAVNRNPHGARLAWDGEVAFIR